MGSNSEIHHIYQSTHVGDTESKHRVASIPIMCVQQLLLFFIREFIQHRMRLDLPGANKQCNNQIILKHIAARSVESSVDLSGVPKIQKVRMRTYAGQTRRSLPIPRQTGMEEDHQTLTLIVPSLSQVEHLKPTSTPSTVIQGIPW